MIKSVTVKKYETPLPDIGEIKRYMGDKNKNPAIDEIIAGCLDECKGVFDCRVCYAVYPVNITGNRVDFGFASPESADLARNLAPADKAVIFAATVGLSADRLIKAYSVQSPLKSLCFDAIGSDATEGLCNRFNEDIGKEFTLCRPRFSPGYGDLDISFQKEIFNELSCPAKIGLYLSSGLQMIPTKSVTAIIGVKDENT